MSTYAVEMHREDRDSEDLKSLGTRADLRAALLLFNTRAETEQVTEEELYGPGIRITLPPYDPTDESGPVTQLTLSEDDTDISFPVVKRIFENHNWDLIDLNNPDKKPLNFYKRSKPDEEEV